MSDRLLRFDAGPKINAARGETEALAVQARKLGELLIEASMLSFEKVAEKAKP